MFKFNMVVVLGSTAKHAQMPKGKRRPLCVTRPFFRTTLDREDSPFLKTTFCDANFLHATHCFMVNKISKRLK